MKPSVQSLEQNQDLFTTGAKLYGAMCKVGSAALSTQIDQVTAQRNAQMTGPQFRRGQDEQQTFNQQQVIQVQRVQQPQPAQSEVRKQPDNQHPSIERITPPSTQNVDKQEQLELQDFIRSKKPGADSRTLYYLPTDTRLTDATPESAKKLNSLVQNTKENLSNLHKGIQALAPYLPKENDAPQ